MKLSVSLLHRGLVLMVISARPVLVAALVFGWMMAVWA
jgi:hypothetical protein